MSIVKNLTHSLLHTHAFGFGVFVTIFTFFFFAGGLVVANGQTIGPSDSHVVNLYVDGQSTSIPTRSATVGDFIAKAQVDLHEGDITEPSLQTPIDADNFRVHIYRAHPVLIIDGNTTKRVLTPETSPQLIAQKAGFTVYPEDTLTLSTPDNFIQDAILGQKLTIDRATPVQISVYSAPAATYRTHAKTVGDVLAESNIVPEPGATVTPSTDTTITPNMAIFVSKYGKTVTTVEEEVPFDIESTPDPSQPAGAITITKAGVKGNKQVVYELMLRDGKEVGRNKIQEVVTVLPQKQSQIIGTKATSILSKSKGVNQFIDSRGVQHRETYYDLPMAVVMNNCGAGGVYTVRADGVKVDKDGYVLIAANLGNYPRCSIVETSVGAGKVYDTGGFASIHTHGFDIATDWSNYDGR